MKKKEQRCYNCKHYVPDTERLCGTCLLIKARFDNDENEYHNQTNPYIVHERGLCNSWESLEQ